MGRSRWQAMVALLVALVVGSALAACGRSQAAPLPRGTLTIQGGGSTATLDVEIADTTESRARGLMGRSQLPPDAGMAFVFDRPTDGGFWMKDTSIPLSIAFWDGTGRIIRILDMAPCHADPCPTYAPGSSYTGAVEVNRGAFAQLQVKVGDHVRLVRR